MPGGGGGGGGIDRQWASVPSPSTRDWKWSTPIFRGATSEHVRNVNAELQDGRLYTDFDDLHRRDVAVIGNDVVNRFFEGEDPIGKVIQVDGHSFQVIGALE